MRRAIVAATILIVSVGLAQAGTRADLSGDAVVDFATTMDMPFMTVGNPGNPGEQSRLESGDEGYYGGVDYTFRMGKFEVTAGQYTEFLNAVAATDTYGLYNTLMPDTSPSARGCNIQRSGSSGSYAYSVAADWEDRPVNYVSWGDAARFANWLTNGMLTGAQGLATTEDGSYFLNGAMSNAELLAMTRKSPEDGGRYYLPTDDEWYKAAYNKDDPGAPGGNYFDYPMSSDAIPTNILVDPDPGNNANWYDGGYTIGIPYYRTEVGEFENSESPYDTFDMGGNVTEWNELVTGSFRGRRGGAFNHSGYAQLASDHFYTATPTEEIERIGFRVAEVPEPASAALMLIVGGFAVRRKGRRIAQTWGATP